jgi:radical SAM superfamily enzyme YgiQ (UPF0313 family)
MVDLPGERFKDIKKTMKYIKEGMKLYNYDLESFRIHLYKFVPFPGTPLFNELKREEIDNLPKSARGWGSYFYEKINDAMQPWEEKNGPSLFASTTFYLWKAYLQREQPVTFSGKILRIISKIRVNRVFSGSLWNGGCGKDVIKKGIVKRYQHHPLCKNNFF